MFLLALLACHPAGDPGDKPGDTGAADSSPADTGGDTQADSAVGTSNDSSDTGTDTTDTDPADTGADTASPCGDCDDGDPCTVDTCDTASGACTSAPFDGSTLDLYDMATLTDPSTLDVEVLSTTTAWEGAVSVQVDEIRYTSYESEGCELRPIRLQAFVAIPDGTALPGLVVAHGLGGYADAGSATTPAAEQGVVTLAYSGPGCGDSEGTGSTPDHLFDTARTPRDSWFWEHSVAAIRGLTVLTQLPEVDPSRLAMAGFSGGAVATWMVAGVDDRVDLAFPVSGTGYLDLPIAATPSPGWEADLLAAMTPPRTAADPEWLAYERWLDPKNFLPSLHASVMLVVGAQDEFFPVNSTAATITDALATGHDVRLLTIPDWDHGWYAYFTGDAAAVDTDAAFTMWLQHGFGLDSTFAELPPTPRVDAIVPWVCYDPDFPWIYWSCAAVQASLDAPTGYEVESATLYWSVDGSLTYASWNLQEASGVWQAEVGTLDGAVWTASNMVYFVEFELRAGAFGPSFKVTSLPNIPPGFSPNILPIDGPLP